MIGTSLIFWLAFSLATQAAASQCEPLIEQYERVYAIPRKLLSAVSLAESGRRVGKSLIAWPWTINANNNSYMFATKQEAITMVRKLQHLGIKSIDVGCMQVNLRHHPKAFENLDEAFEPAANVAYAAKLLHEKKMTSGSWYHAVAHYHSATAKFHLPYKARVLKIWSQVQHRDVTDQIAENVPFELRKSALELIVADIGNHTGEYMDTVTAPSGRRLPLKIVFRPYQGFKAEGSQNARLYFYGRPKQAGNAENEADITPVKASVASPAKARVKKAVPVLIRTGGAPICARGRVVGVSSLKPAGRKASLTQPRRKTNIRLRVKSQ